MDTIINYEHKIDQQQEVSVYSMSLPSSFRVQVDARGSLKFCQVAILAARPAQLLGLKHATTKKNCCIVNLGSEISLPLSFAQSVRGFFDAGI